MEVELDPVTGSRAGSFVSGVGTSKTTSIHPNGQDVSQTPLEIGDLPDDAFLAIADIITGDAEGSPRVRGSFGLTRLFSRCGVAVEYDGSSKRAWTTRQLKEVGHDGFIKILAQLLSPTEYGGDHGAAADASALLDRSLIRTGVRFSLIDGTGSFTRADPVVIEPLTTAASAHSGLVMPDFEQLDISAAEAQNFLFTWREIELCYRATAYLAATIMLGSLLESILLVALKRNRGKLAPAGVIYHDARNQERPPEKWSLSEMIEAASQLGWTNQKARAFSHSLREYRNLVHPELRRRPNDMPTGHECLIGSIIVASLVNDLRTAINSTSKGGPN